MQSWLTADLWEKEVGHLADCSSRCLSQGLLADVLYVPILQPNNRQHVSMHSRSSLFPITATQENSTSLPD